MFFCLHSLNLLRVAFFSVEHFIFCKYAFLFIIFNLILNHFLLYWWTKDVTFLNYFPCLGQWCVEWVLNESCTEVGVKLPKKKFSQVYIVTVRISHLAPDSLTVRGQLPWLRMCWVKSSGCRSGWLRDGGEFPKAWLGLASFSCCNKGVWEEAIIPGCTASFAFAVQALAERIQIAMPLELTFQLLLSHHRHLCG